VPGALDGLQERLGALALGPTIARRAVDFVERDPAAARPRIELTIRPPVPGRDKAAFDDEARDLDSGTAPAPVPSSVPMQVPSASATLVAAVGELSPVGVRHGDELAPTTAQLSPRDAAALIARHRDEVLALAPSSPIEIKHGDLTITVRSIDDLERVLVMLRALDEGLTPPAHPTPVLALFISAEPSDQVRLSAQREYKTIKEQLRATLENKRLRLEVELEVTPNDVARFVAMHKPRIVHFCGHGDGLGQLVFSDGNGATALLPPEDLAQVFELLGQGVRCVVMTACYANIQAKMLAAHVDFVVGMSSAIAPKAAIEFAGVFYQQLALATPVRVAFELARSAARRTGAEGAEAPTLEVRPGRDAATALLF
jgi:hypothetical protein